jgi:hypothetical protein
MIRRNGFFLLLAASFALAACGGGATGGTAAGGSGGESGGSGGTGAAGGTTGGSGGDAGGASTGGASTGGSSTGGSSSGGMPQCTDDSQCQLVNDCCSCLAVGPGEPAPDCNISECFVPTCQGLGKQDETAKCVAGQCVAALNCDHSKVTCESLPPSCPPGQTPTVNGVCWGGCVAADECALVADCGQCTGGLACVSYLAQTGPENHCVEPQPGCNGQATCECMGDAVCLSPFGLCLQIPGGLGCECPNCAQ